MEPHALRTLNALYLTYARHYPSRRRLALATRRRGTFPAR